MIPEVKLILSLIKEPINEDKVIYLIEEENIDWEIFRGFITYHDLIPYIYPNVQSINYLFPPEVYLFLSDNYKYNLRRVLELWGEFLRIYNTFSEERIEIIPIKGMSFLEDIYTNTVFRPMVDIDLLVRKENLGSSEEVFLNLGYDINLEGLKKTYWLRKQCHISFARNDNTGFFSIDLHFSLDLPRKKRILRSLWSRIREIDVNGKKIKVLSPEDAVFSLILHQRRYGKVLLLKSIMDCGLLLKKYGDRFNWDYFVQEATNGEMCSVALFMLLQVQIFYGAYIPKYVVHNLKIPYYKKRLIRRFIENNTFSLALSSRLKDFYLKKHFLLYDNFWEPIVYILKIPLEQFAKFYGLQPYDKKTASLYKRRLLYIPFKKILSLFNSLKE